MKRIYILHTGGTIGMQPTTAGLAPKAGALTQPLAALIPDSVNYTLDECIPLIDSANATPADWQMIAQTLRNNAANYDGFIVLHGTDTLAYTASALAFLLPGFAKPIVVTGAQFPLFEAASDGANNIRCAVLAALHPNLHEVVVVFDRVMLRGCRVRKVASTAFAGFDSPNCTALAHFEFEMAPIWTTESWWPNPTSLTVRNVDSAMRCAMFSIAPGATIDVLASVLEQGLLDGIVLQSYGVGNMPTTPRLLQALSQAIERGCVVVNVSQSLRGGVQPGTYAVSSAVLHTGVVSGADMTPEAALTKLYVLLSTYEDRQEVARLMAENLVGEMSD